MATVVLIGELSTKRVTVLPASAVPVNNGVDVLNIVVKLSLSCGISGGVESTSNDNTVEFADSFPAVSVATAVME